MVIYGEWLFLENAVAGIMILCLTEEALGREISWRRKMLASMACGLYAFTIFLPLGGAFSAVLNVTFSAALLIPLFGIQKLWKTMILFYVMTGALGGATIALMYLFRIPAITHGAGIYIGSLNAWQVIPGVMAGYLGLLCLCHALGVRSFDRGRIRSIQIDVGDQTLKISGLVDTGNFLRDPVSGKPAILVSEEALAPLRASLTSDRYCVLPFQSAGNACGIMDGFRPDRIRVGGGSIYNGNPCVPTVEAVVGIYKGTFSPTENGCAYQALLHPELEKMFENDPKHRKEREEENEKTSEAIALSEEMS